MILFIRNKYPENMVIEKIGINKTDLKLLFIFYFLVFILYFIFLIIL